MDPAQIISVSALLFLSVATGSYLVVKRLAPLYSRFRSDTVSRTVSTLDEQFLFLTPRQAGLFHLFLALAAVVISAVVLWEMDWLWLVLSATGAGYVGYQAPRLMTFLLWKRRIKTITNQIPDFLRMMSGALRAGLSVPEAVTHVVREIPAPLSQEFGLVLKKIRMGESFEESFKFLEKRLDIEEVSLVVSAMILSNEAGGSLTPLLERIQDTVAERTRVRGKIQALTAQGRMQGWVVGVLPLILGFILYLIDPALVTFFWTTPAGQWGLASMIFLEVLGFWLIRKIIEEGAV